MLADAERRCCGPACVAEKTPPPLNSVFVDSTRSAAPPIIVGVKRLNASIVFRPRRASPSPRRPRTRAAPRPSRRAAGPVCTWSQSSRSARVLRRPRVEPLAATPARARARARVAFMCSRTSSGTRNVASGSQPSASFVARTSVLAERRAVRLRRVDRVRRAEGDVRADRRSATAARVSACALAIAARAARRGRSRRRRAGRASPAPRAARPCPRP